MKLIYRFLRFSFFSLVTDIFCFTANCAELYKDGKTTSGVYTIDPDGLGAFNVYCDQNTTGGGWTVIHKRLNGSVSFYQSWCKYKNGFGDPNGEYWLGLEKMNRLTWRKNNTLRVDLEITRTRIYAEYDLFEVESECKHYSLIIGGISRGKLFFKS